MPRVVTLTLIALATVIASCSSDSGEPSGKDQPSAVSSPSPSVTQSDSPAVSRTTRITPGEGGEIEIGLADLRVRGKLATLRLVFTPHFRSDRSGTISLLDMAGGRGGSVTLLDSVNLRRYVVVKDSRNETLGANPATTRTVNNQPVDATFTFAAPPANVTTIGVYLDDQVVFDDVEIMR